MILDLKIEIDWLEEDMSVSDAVKQSIIYDVKRQVSEPVIKQIKEAADTEIRKQLEAETTKAISSRIEKYLSTPRTITDSFGDVIKEDVTVESLLKEKIESAFSKKTLDNDGKTTSYNPRHSLFEYLVIRKTDSIPEMVSKMVESETKDTQETIERLVKDSVKTNVADKLTDLIMENSTALSLRSESK